jgi:hypothetical protein
VDLLQVVDLDLRLLLFDGDLLLDRVRVVGLQRPETCVAFEASTLLLDVEQILDVLHVLARDVLVVLEAPLIQFGLPLHALVRSFFLGFYVVSNRVAVLLLELLLERLPSRGQFFDDGVPRLGG